jgi:hypothetical protein
MTADSSDCCSAVAASTARRSVVRLRTRLDAAKAATLQEQSGRRTSTWERRSSMRVVCVVCRVPAPIVAADSGTLAVCRERPQGLPRPVRDGEHLRVALLKQRRAVRAREHAQLAAHAANLAGSSSVHAQAANVDVLDARLKGGGSGPSEAHRTGGKLVLVSRGAPSGERNNTVHAMHSHPFFGE